MYQSMLDGQRGLVDARRHTMAAVCGRLMLVVLAMSMT